MGLYLQWQDKYSILSDIEEMVIKNTKVELFMKFKTMYQYS